MLKKTALHIGAGKIGRGFIGKLLFQNDYAVTFMDINEDLVAKINAERSYKVTLLDQETSSKTITNINAITSGHISSGRSSMVPFVNGLSLITTAVGVDVLPTIARNIATIIEIRNRNNVTSPLHVIACENTVRATSVLKSKTINLLDAEHVEYLNNYLFFIDCAVDRIIPNPQTEFNPADKNIILDIGVEKFSEMKLDRLQLQHADIALEGEGIAVVDNLDAYIDRKRFTLNTAHVALAYMGLLKDCTTVLEAIENSSVESFAKSVMAETKAVLIHEYNFSEDELDQYQEKIMNRFRNPYISDRLIRIGRQPLRKLKPEDRIIAPLVKAIDYDLPHESLLHLTAVALHYSNVNDSQSIELQTKIKESGISNYIATLIGQLPLDIDEEKVVCKKVYDYYCQYL